MQPPDTHTQYFEMFGNRAIYQDGWVAGARHWQSWDTADSFDFANDRWELFNVGADFSEAHDVARQYPDKLKALQRLFDAEARRNDVYPLGAGYSGNDPSLIGEQRKFVYYAGTPRVPETAMPRLSGMSFRLTAAVSIPATGAQGVILSYGGRESGFAFYLRDDRLFMENNLLNGVHEVLASNTRIPRGKVSLTYEFSKESDAKLKSYWGWPLVEVSSGTGRLFINGQPAGEAKISGATVYPHLAPGSLGIGQEFGSPVSNAFVPPFKFSGTVDQVTVELK